ncbi:MAG: hydrogenase expression/formation protein HypE [Cytophagales bacterium]|nr:hydrogenase expression/formation protein HypE [Cytophagales bacterium]
MGKKISFSCPMPEFDFDTITLAHGSGGLLTNKLLDQGVFSLFSNEYLDRQHDGAVFYNEGKLAFSTDSFVVSPIFFPGGNIGDLSMNGTMNDLAMCGAVPKFISLGLIIEEGLSVRELWKILESIKGISDAFDVQVVTGDTKVVERGKGDKIFINTSGIGVVKKQANIGIERIKEGDRILVSGNIATHGMTIMSVRKGLEFQTALESDTQYIGDTALELIDNFGSDIKFLRDPTRGGLATVLNEIAGKLELSIEIEEALLPILHESKSACELLGLDPIYVANEGLFVAVVSPEISGEALDFLKQNEKCEGAAFIGSVTSAYPKKVVVKSAIGGRRIASMLPGEQLPRIC